MGLFVFFVTIFFFGEVGGVLFVGLFLLFYLVFFIVLFQGGGGAFVWFHKQECTNSSILISIIRVHNSQCNV